MTVEFIAKPRPPSTPCNFRSVEECTHKFDGVSQEEINEIIREDRCSIWGISLVDGRM
jgi:hypothetical protein